MSTAATPSSYQDLCSLLADDARLVVTARMHAGIAALCAGVPVVFLGYERKHKALLEMLGREDLYVDFESFDAGSLSSVMQLALEVDRDELMARVAEFSSSLASIASSEEYW